MNAARLTLIGLLAAAFIAGGCSRDNRPTGPGTDTPPGIQMNRSDNSPSAAWDADRTDIRNTEVKPVRLTIVAQVLRTPMEGGCLYLEAEKGETYTPLCPKSLTLNNGMILKAEGYVDENINFFCGNGPAFVIIDYEILKKSAWTADEPTTKRASDFEPSKDKTSDASSDKPRLMNAVIEPVPIIFGNNDMSEAPDGKAIFGDIRHAKSGCLLLTTAENDVYELHSNKPYALLPKDGSYVRVTGYVSSLPYWTCEEATVFNVESITVLKRPRMSDRFGFELNDAAKPVPIIFGTDDISAAPSGTPIEGYTRHTKSGCLMLTTTKKEVYELHSNNASDLALQDGSYVRVTGYVSSLPYWTCEEATVFNVESITILKRPKMSDRFGTDSRASAIEANTQEYVDIVGEMHSVEPEGGCWVFSAEDGHDYELIFSQPVSLRSGMRLRIKGVRADVSTFCHSGKPIEVTDWIVLNENKF